MPPSMFFFIRSKLPGSIAVVGNGQWITSINNRLAKRPRLHYILVAPTDVKCSDALVNNTRRLCGTSSCY